jgi:hypothetical protein
MMIAITRRTWIKPPTVLAVITPKSHSTKRIIAIVVSISVYCRLLLNLTLTRDVKNS